jgi:hypothetical protein
MTSFRSGRLLSLWSALLAALVLLVTVVEFSLVHPNGDYNVTYFDELADAFLAGQTYLLRSPPPDMMALPDPWDPAANARFREPPSIPGQRFTGVHDLSLYQGRLYLQWGPVPAIILIPLRWVAGGDLPMGRLVLVVETIAALCYVAATMKLAHLAGLPRSRLTSLVTVVAITFCPAWTFILDRIAVYETGVFIAQLFMALALLSIVAAFEGRLRHGKGAFGLLAIGSLCLGLVVNCRPNLALLGLMVPVVLLVWYRTAQQRVSWQRCVTAAIALGGPAALLLACVLGYNAWRFGNILESGQDWLLWAGDESITLHKFSYLSFGRVVPNIWYYFFSPPSFAPDLPIFVRPKLVEPGSWMGSETLATYGRYVNRTSGLFVVEPLAAATLLAPFLLRTAPIHGATKTIRWLPLLLLLAGALAGAVLFLAPAAMRYGAEWCMWWIMAGVLVASRIRVDLRARQNRIGAALFDAALVGATFWSAWVGLCYLPVWIAA